jgi:hypothetical protein
VWAECQLWGDTLPPLCPYQGLGGGVVFLDSSVLVTVPSGAWVTVFSFDLTVPSLLTVLLLVLETSRSHPTSTNDNAKADMATQATITRFFMEVTYGMGWMPAMG